MAGVVYLIKYGTSIDYGYIDKIASNEEAIKKIVRKDDGVMASRGVIDVSVDFKKSEINYTYKDWCGEIVEGKLYFDKIEIV